MWKRRSLIVFVSIAIWLGPFLVNNAMSQSQSIEASGEFVAWAMFGLPVSLLVVLAVVAFIETMNSGRKR